MRVAWKVIISTAILITAAPGALGASSGGSTRWEFFQFDPSSPPDSGYRVHANFGAGYGAIKGSHFASDPSGEQFLGTVSWGRRTRKWEWDTGLGWGYSRRAGIDNNGNPVSITIRSARADGSVRYRLIPGVQIGPIAALTFGTDTGFDLHLGDPRGTLYGGVKLAIDLPHLDILPFQLWGEALTELTQPGRDAFTTIIGLRLSLPVNIRKTTDSMELTQAEPRRDVRVVLDANRVFFRTDSSRIRPEFASALDDLARYLKQFPDRWESIEISGHTDRRGTLPYNMALSKRRASSVEKQLLSQGIESGRVQVEFHGPTKPLDPANRPVAWAKNRRVELIFKNVSEADPLQEKLAPLKRGPVLFSNTRDYR